MLTIGRRGNGGARDDLGHGELWRAAGSSGERVRMITIARPPSEQIGSTREFDTIHIGVTCRDIPTQTPVLTGFLYSLTWSQQSPRIPSLHSTVMAEKDASARLRRAVKGTNHPFPAIHGSRRQTENNLFLVKRLIKRTDMRNPDPQNKRFTSLAWAAVLGHEETFEFLLSSGHDDHEYSKDSENNTILILLADARPPVMDPFGGQSDQDFLGATLRMARMYYDRYPDVLDWANIEGKTALHKAALKGNEELVRMLCDLGADYDLADNDGNTPLHHASAWGHIPVVQLLIERGCQYSARNNEGFTPSDYAYSISTRDTLQDTARIQFENNKKARRNVFAQAAARGNEWGGSSSGQLYPSSPRAPVNANSSVRMRSGSGTSRTTNTSDSGDLVDNQPSGPSSRLYSTLNSSFSPSRQPIPLPSGSHSPGQPSTSSASSTYTFSAVSPVSQPPSASLAPTANSNSNPASALSPIATRMLQLDADAMEKYKMRQRSGSATTTSTDTHSHNGSTMSSAAPAPRHEDDISALSSLVGSVAPRRRLRPSASAAQLRTTPQPLTLSQGAIPSQPDSLRNRSGTSPAMLKHSPPASSPTTDATALSTPTQNSASSRPGVSHSGSLGGPSKDKVYTGPSKDYARFPPPPVSEEPPAERAATPTAAAAATPTHSRRLPFNLLSAHRVIEQQLTAGGHRRNASVNTAVR
ncbi:Protein phosphatase 1 regulatory subunit 12C [Grifola frondosa]|uniref:Protein phosphatase 1 regulatory subunit 12C n=1 Tax=Grifola frondosa TaxID=5627 RepID=A0A1C7LZS2_GRIFR|nr:Protein phosphatase 1 regulatory subunit 12C [Grifola frondosa]